MLRHKTELERLNYYSWAKFLKGVNDDNALVRVIDKLEVSRKVVLCSTKIICFLWM